MYVIIFGEVDIVLSYDFIFVEGDVSLVVIVNLDYSGENGVVIFFS